MKNHLTSIFAACVFGFPTGFFLAFFCAPFLTGFRPFGGILLASDGKPSGFVLAALITISVCAFYALFRWSLNKR